jgi:site-specific DNA-methyltransferase (adenine-specific)
VTHQELVAEVQLRTGITDHALARKLGVLPTKIREWQGGAPIEGAEALAALQDLMDKAKSARARDSARAERPVLSSNVVCADSLETLRSLPDESVDLIASDIPYGIGLDDWDILHNNENGAYLGTSSAQQKAGDVFKKRRKPINGWSTADRSIPREYYEWCSSWSPEWFRVLKPGASCALEDAGFNLRDTLGWIRPQAVFRAQRLSVVYQKRGELGEAKKWSGFRLGNLRPTFEPILWCFKPYDVTLADNVLDHGVGAFNLDGWQERSGGTDNHIHCGFGPLERGYHEAQKPLLLMEALIELCTIEGQLVLDPFAGSGSTVVAAKNLGRRYIAVERNPELCTIISKRLSM